MNRKAHVACNFNSFIKTKGLLKVTGYHVWDMTLTTPLSWVICHTQCVVVLIMMSWKRLKLKTLLLH